MRTPCHFYYWICTFDQNSSFLWGKFIFNRKWLAHEGISKWFFLDHFSSSFKAKNIIFCHIFNFHRADQSWIYHILGVKWWALFSRDSRFAQTENPKSDCCLIQKLKRVLKRDKSLQFSKSIRKSPSFGIILQKAFSLQIVFYWIECTVRS